MRTTTTGTFCMFMILVSFFNFSDAYAQSCNSELKVSKNRDSRSASANDPTQFQLELTNNTSSVQSYQIEVIRYEGAFMVDGKAPNLLSSNASLDTSVYYNNVQNNTITVPAASKVVFLTSVSVPSGTPVNRWGGLEVKAINSACPDGLVSTLLKLYVTDSSEE